MGFKIRLGYNICKCYEVGRENSVGYRNVCMISIDLCFEDVWVDKFFVFRLECDFSLKVRVSNVFFNVLSLKCFMNVDKLKFLNMFLVLFFIDLVILLVWLGLCVILCILLMRMW